MKIDKTIAKYRKHLIGFVDEGGNKKSYLNDRILINLLIKLSDLMADGNKIIINTIRAHIMIANSTNENLSMPPNQASSNLGVVQGDMAYMPSKYSKAFNTYSRTQIKSIMPFIASISRTCSYSSLYPICKVLKAISKIYMLNEIEMIFLAYLIRETGWDIRDKTIFHNAQNVQDIIYYSIDNLDYKRIILYLMITAFTVKFYLNQNTVEILEEATKRCPNFKQIFQCWNKKHSTIITKINPRTLNIVYKKLYSSVKEDQPDFNMMVDAIIQISPAYNPEREKQNNQQTKKKPLPERKDPEVIIKKQEPSLKYDKSGFIPPSAAMFSSSGLLNMMTLHQQSLGTNDNNPNLSGVNPFMLGKSDRIRQDYLGILGSSVVGGIEGSGYDINQEDDCGELVVGLHDGQSEQNIIFEQKAVNSPGVGFQPVRQSNQHSSVIIVNPSQQLPYYTSVITLTRRPSIKKDGMGTSQIFMNAGQSTNKNRRQASIVNLEGRPKQNKEKDNS